jgi:drug/metabolite transporter (DMT)-like permease
MNPRPLSQRAALIAVILACVIWGASFLFAKIALAELPVGHVVLWRFAIATVLLAPLAVRRGLPRGRDLPLFALTGILCVPISLVLQFEGLARTSVASASLVVGTGTPLLALAGAAFRRERLGARGWLAVALSTVGLAIVVGLPGPGRTWLGDLLVFASMVVTAGWVILAMPLVARYGGLAATAWILGSGSLAQLPLAWLLDGAPRIPESALGWGALIALSVFCTGLAFALWNRGLERVEASRASVYINLEPVVGAFLGVTLLGDPMSPGLAGGGGLVLAASLLASLPAKREAEAMSMAPIETPSPASSRKAA